MQQPRASPRNNDKMKNAACRDAISLFFEKKIENKIKVSSVIKLFDYFQRGGAGTVRKNAIENRYSSEIELRTESGDDSLSFPATLFLMAMYSSDFEYILKIIIEGMTVMHLLSLKKNISCVRL